MKTNIKIFLIILIEILLNLTFRILQSRLNSNSILIIGYALIAIIVLFLGIKWISTSSNYIIKYWKSVATIFSIILAVVLISDILYQLLYDKYVFKPMLFLSLISFVQGIIFILIVSLIMGLFFRPKKIIQNLNIDQ
jgi:hypothetical protein